MIQAAAFQRNRGNNKIRFSGIHVFRFMDGNDIHDLEIKMLFQPFQQKLRRPDTRMAGHDHMERDLLVLFSFQSGAYVDRNVPQFNLFNGLADILLEDRQFFPDRGSHLRVFL